MVISTMNDLSGYRGATRSAVNALAVDEQEH
jgi:hypothetical protein